MIRSRIRFAVWPAAGVLAAVAAGAATPGATVAPVAPPPAEVETDKFCREFRVDVGERTSGDKYVAGKSVVVDGYHDGDLAIVGESATIQGEVTGDVFFFGDTLDISGHVRDTVRVMASNVYVSGTVDGDLMMFGNLMTVRTGGRVAGDVLGFGARLRLDGDVDRDVRLTAGEIQIGGTIRGDARLKADTIVFGERGRIEGDLDYQANRKLDAEVASRVGGEVEFREKVEEPEEEEDRALTAGDVAWWLLWWGIWTLGAVLAGLSLVGLARPAVDRARASISADPLMSALVGFGAFLVLPAGSLIMTVLAPPFGLSGWLVFALILLLAKIPVGVWLGSRILALVGRRDASPTVALLVGVPLLYLAAELPYLIGWAVWGLTTWLGLGATLLGHFGRRDAAGAEDAPAT